ncbi:hypothetical protein G7046_g7295 [Stylonectria norvegica]|nr:hypothetical protein G7046_g7295 [Stylonectria norvegica]
MAGRQAHGRSLIAAPKTKAKPNKQSKARSQKNALDAFGIAQEKFAPKEKKTPRSRELDADIERKHGRDDDEDEDEEEDEEEPQRKKPKRPTRGADDDDGANFGSDSEGNEWQMGGLREDDDDSEIESDDAFGESDEEKFQGYTFRGSKSTQEKDDDSEDDSQDDEGETLGAEAIDLATALDQFEDEDDESKGKAKPESDDSDDDASDESEEDEEEDDSDEDDEDDGADPEKLEALRGLISGYGGEEEETDAKNKTKRKIDLSDLGLTGIDDPFVKKSMKLLNKEEKEKRPGAASKLNVPLGKREQDRMDRSAAYEKTNATLDRWNETVKQNRRAEHLAFPLPQNSATAGLDTTEIQPINVNNPSNELESTIMSIMAQSGLSLDKPEKPKEQEFDDEGNAMSRKEAANKRRIDRELASREEKKAKRIKKIKSKAYHRVHRRQRERDDIATREAMEEAGEIDSEAEREAQDRRRALERVGARHKDSKWAKIGNKVKRAVWDDDFRAGLTEMGRKDEELRRRKEGKGEVSDSESDSSVSGSEAGDAALRRQLDELENDGDDEPQTGLMGMKFMQKAEAAKKQANDDLVKQIRRDLDGESSQAGSDEEVDEVGRRQYGAADGTPFAPTLDTSSRAGKKHRSGVDDDDVVITTKSKLSKHEAVPGATDTSSATFVANPNGGAWSKGETRRKKKKGSSSARIEDLDLTSNILVASRPIKPKPTKSSSEEDQADADADSDTEQHLPLAIRDQEMVARAFAGEDVVGDFQREKDDIAEADDDKVIDNTLPGWGSWVGEGVSAKELKRHKGRFLTKVEGIKKKNRKDAKLDKVIVNEKRIKKNDRYLASQLPHPFESREQYERSLRLPVGPEWMTKEVFQDSTKPRVLMKQGIIAPMSKPTI